MATRIQNGLLGWMAESYRLSLLRGLEQNLAGSGYRLVAGVDEAGRGCLAGPVVAAAVVVDPDCWIPGVDDSKKLDAGSRHAVAEVIRQQARCYATCAVDAEAIERSNILQATKLAMWDCVAALDEIPDVVLVDAVEVPDLPYPSLPIVRGDCLSFAIACASILAKTRRDELMLAYHAKYPEYGFDENKGYAAPQHLRALEELGPTPLHRLTFRSVIPRRDEIRAAHE